MKLPSLRTALFMQAGVVLMVPLYFVLLWTYKIKLGIWGFVWIFVGNILQSWLVKRVKAEVDECALQTLRTVLASCFQSAEIVIVVGAMWLAIGSAKVAEYMPLLLLTALFLIYLERAILFAYWDKKGLPPC